MVLDTFVSSDLSNFIIYETISASEQSYRDSPQKSFFLDNNGNRPSKPYIDGLNLSSFSENLHRSSPMMFHCLKPSQSVEVRPNSSTQSKKKRRRKPRVCINKEEAENQRMTHIVVERNRRKQMNEHLAVMRSLMPESYVHRGDQASIVGGAIDFVKELEQLLQSLEAQKWKLQKQRHERSSYDETTITIGNPTNNYTDDDLYIMPPFAQFFTCPQYYWCQVPREHPLENRPAIADIEVAMIETHANIRILSKRRPRQLLKMVAGFHELRLTILHLNVTTLDQLVLYSFSTKVEEGCCLNSVDEIAGAVQHILTMIEEEAGLCSGEMREIPQIAMALAQNYLKF